LAEIIYTIGYDARELEEFLDILEKYSIGLVIDVRRWPKSRFQYYSRGYLENILASKNIGYIWLGKELGGFRGGYIEYMVSKEFINGARRLLKIVKEVNSKHFSCILCRERIPWRCHRRFLASLLYSLGYKVIHIIGLGHVIEQNYPLEHYGLDPKYFIEKLANA